MVLFPEKYRVYWYVTDYWGKFYAVPVQVERICGIIEPRLTIRFDFVGNIDHVYDASRRELYKTQKKAVNIAVEMNRKEGYL